MVMQNKFYLRVLAAILFVAVFTTFIGTQSVFAQYGSSSSLSPWLGLTNRPMGSLDNYNQYVRPQLEMQKAFQAQQAQINQQGMMQQDMMRRSNPGAGGQLGKHHGAQTAGGVSQPATFRNYSHYYNFRR